MKVVTGPNEYEVTREYRAGSSMSYGPGYMAVRVLVSNYAEKFPPVHLLLSTSEAKKLAYALLFQAQEGSLGS